MLFLIGILKILAICLGIRALGSLFRLGPLPDSKERESRSWAYRGEVVEPDDASYTFDGKIIID